MLRQDARQVQAELATAAAGVALAEAQLLASKQRLLQLQADEQAIAQAAKERAASALEAQRAQSAVQVAQADVVAQEAAIGAAKAQYEAVAVRMDDLTLRAPFAGDVVMAPAEVGAWLAEGDVAFVVASQELEVEVAVPERHWQGLQPVVAAGDASLSVRIGDGLVLQATDVRLVRQLDAAARTVPLIARLPSDAPLADGLTAQVLVPVAAAQPTKVVPRSAVIRGGAVDQLFVVAASEGGPPSARPQVVQVLFETSDGFAIAADALAVGAQVIVEGNERLRPGQALNILNADQP